MKKQGIILVINKLKIKLMMFKVLRNERKEQNLLISTNGILVKLGKK